MYPHRQNLKGSRQGSALLWVMVALVVISLTTATVLSLSYQFFGKSAAAHNDNTAYQAAYSLTASLSDWIAGEGGDRTGNGDMALTSKRDFLAMLDSGPVTLTPKFDALAEAPEAPEPLPQVQSCKAVVSYGGSADAWDKSTIEIVSTAEVDGKIFTVSSRLRVDGVPGDAASISWGIESFWGS